jgi:hypothetical protein
MKYNDNDIQFFLTELNYNDNYKGFFYYLKQKIGDFLFPLFFYSFQCQKERYLIDLICITIETIQLLSYPLNSRVNFKFKY